jgi:cytoskeletal protein CcmA (bactofilin family)
MFQKPSPDIALSQERREDGSHDEVETVVGPSVHVEGDFASEGNILVKGIVSGNVKTSRRLTVEEGAKIFANVKAGAAFISGEIQGNVKTDKTLELTSTARIAGDIHCDILVVEAGALIHGKVTMKGIKAELDEKPERKRMTLRSRTKTEKKEPKDSKE